MPDKRLSPYFELVALMYLTERCKFCRKQWRTIDDLFDTVWAGYHDYGRLACKGCWKNMTGHRFTIATALLFSILIGLVLWTM